MVADDALGRKYRLRPMASKRRGRCNNSPLRDVAQPANGRSNDVPAPTRPVRRKRPDPTFRSSWRVPVLMSWLTLHGGSDGQKLPTGTEARESARRGCQAWHHAPDGSDDGRTRKRPARRLGPASLLRSDTIRSPSSDSPLRRFDGSPRRDAPDRTDDDGTYPVRPSWERSRGAILFPALRSALLR